MTPTTPPADPSKIHESIAYDEDSSQYFFKGELTLEEVIASLAKELDWGPRVIEAAKNGGVEIRTDYFRWNPGSGEEFEGAEAGEVGSFLCTIAEVLDPVYAAELKE